MVQGWVATEVPAARVVGGRRLEVGMAPGDRGASDRLPPCPHLLHTRPTRNQPTTPRRQRERPRFLTSSLRDRVCFAGDRRTRFERRLRPCAGLGRLVELDSRLVLPRGARRKCRPHVDPPMSCVPCPSRRGRIQRGLYCGTRHLRHLSLLLVSRRCRPVGSGARAWAISPMGATGRSGAHLARA